MRLGRIAIVGGVLGGVALAIAGTTLALSDSALPVRAAQAQSPQQNPLERARTAVETLINRLRGRDMPEEIVKTNGRLEATQVDVSAKYSGRLAAVNVDEGDEVTAGQVVATISSPETEAQLRAAQARDQGARGRPRRDQGYAISFHVCSTNAD
jgi:HlyD family secretion protein